jgi:hypothetical protein
MMNGRSVGAALKKFGEGDRSRGLVDAFARRFDLPEDAVLGVGRIAESTRPSWICRRSPCG